MNLDIRNDFNRDHMGNRVLPTFKTEVWMDGRWLSTAKGWKADEVEEYAIKLAEERLQREKGKENE